MAKPNYSFEKRQRELAKKKKKEEKLREKADRKSGSDGPSGQYDPDASDESQEPQASAPLPPPAPS